MDKTEKYFSVQYKDWTCCQTPCFISASGYVQSVINKDLDIQHEYYDGIIIRSTKRQLYRYLKWYVDSGKYKTLPKTYEYGDPYAREIPEGLRLRRRMRERRRTHGKN